MKYDGEVWRELLKEHYGNFPVDKDSITSVVKELIGEAPPDFVSDIVADLIKQGVLMEISPGVYKVTPAPPKPVVQKESLFMIKVEVYDDLKDLQEIVGGNQLCDPDIVKHQFEIYGVKLSDKELIQILKDFGCATIKKQLKTHPPATVINAVMIELGNKACDPYALFEKFKEYGYYVPLHSDDMTKALRLANENYKCGWIV